MKRFVEERSRLTLKACCLLLLLAALIACRLGGDGGSDTGRGKPRASGSGNSRSEAGDEANAELCRKYESCGCVTYASCMEQFKGDPNLEKPGVRACMLISSCQSLCASDPDACKSGGTGTGSGARSNCTAISCTKDSDCPADCSGGCDGVRCYSF
jgi:hypothetical protein